MSEARTVWQDLDVRRSTTASRKRIGMLLVAGLLIGMCAAEVAFLSYVVGPDTINAVATAEGMPVGPD
jgi:hypothetical protein